ncbi:MAG TPA: S9 family peptidase [Allosphingosinicella sp.]|jgi:dipeptidyl aminopeptidase/acylaminoacyl peptidase
MIFRLLVGVAVVALTAGSADAADPAEQFGVRESVEAIRLSPDGSKLAYLAPTSRQGSALYIIDLKNGQSRLTTSADGDTQRLSGCSWVSNARLVCSVYAMISDGDEIYPVSRVIAVNEDGSSVKMLSDRDSFYSKTANLYGGSVIDWLPDANGAVLMSRNFVPEQRQNTRLEKKERGLGVDRIDTMSQSSQRVETPRPNAVEYISDGRGNVRIMGTQAPNASGYTGRTVNYFYRAKASREWKPFGTYNVLTRDGLNPYAVDADLDVAYAIEKTDGRDALYKVSLDGSLKKELVFSHPQVDVGGILRIGRRGRVVGATYATEKPEAAFFDPQLKGLAASLGKVLPGLPLIRFVDSSADENKLLLWAGSDTDPGRYYIYDKAARKLDEIMLSRPQLEGVKLASVKPVSYKAADGTSIPAYLTLPPGKESAKGLPALVMPHGGPGARDEWGFDWLSQYFANRGYAVLQPNFRGSAGYGDAWFQKNGFQSWRTAIGDVNDAGRWLVAQGVADPAKLGIFGWSYGGYAALQSSVLDPTLYKAIVAVAPVTDLDLLKEESRGWTNFALVRDFIGSGPHVREGSPAQNASSIKAPVLMFHGTLDRNVGIRESQLMKNRLQDAGKKVVLVEYQKLDHYLEDSAARTDMLRRSDAFLKSSLGL